MLKAIHSRVKLATTAMVLGFVGLVPAIATAPAPPQLVKATMNGQPIHVLYLTRSGDKVLVRCYPGQQPKMQLRTRADGVKEGTVICGK